MKNGQCENEKLNTLKKEPRKRPDARSYRSEGSLNILLNAAEKVVFCTLKLSFAVYARRRVTKLFFFLLFVIPPLPTSKAHKIIQYGHILYFIICERKIIQWRADVIHE